MAHVGSRGVVPRPHNVRGLFVQGTVVTPAPHHPMMVLLILSTPRGVLPPTEVRTLAVTPRVPPPEAILVLERWVPRPLVETWIHHRIAIGRVRETGGEIVWLHVRRSPGVGRGQGVCPFLPHPLEHGILQEVPVVHVVGVVSRVRARDAGTLGVDASRVLGPAPTGPAPH